MCLDWHYEVSKKKKKEARARAQILWWRERCSFTSCCFSHINKFRGAQASDSKIKLYIESSTWVIARKEQTIQEWGGLGCHSWKRLLDHMAPLCELEKRCSLLIDAVVGMCIAYRAPADVASTIPGCRAWWTWFRFQPLLSFSAECLGTSYFYASVHGGAD